MPPKRKRVYSFEEEQRVSKRPKTESSLSDLDLQKYPDDLLLEILGHLPQMSLCAASMTCKRFNDVFEALFLKDLSKNLGKTSNIAAMASTTKKLLKEIFYPRAQYLALERAIIMASKDDSDSLEKLLNRLHNWVVLKISERRNNRRLKNKLPERWKRIEGRYGYKEISPVNKFALWGDTDSGIHGGKFRVSFCLFGQKEHFVEVSCDVFSYCEHSGGHYACKLALDAKLHKCTGAEEIAPEVKGLLEGYVESHINVDYKKGDKYRDWLDHSGFIREYLAGDRVRRKWFYVCYPKLNKEKLNQVNEWLGWNMSPLELAEALADLSMNPSAKYNEAEDDENEDEDEPCSPYESDEVAPLVMDIINIKTALEQLPSLMLKEDDLDSLIQIEQTLSVLTATVSLKNRIRDEWKDKDESKVRQIMTLIDRSMYTKWSRMAGIFQHCSNDELYDPNYRLYYCKGKCEIKLVGEEPSKIVRFKFAITWCGQDPELFSDDDEAEYFHSISTSTGKRANEFNMEPWSLPESQAELLQRELGLENFSTEEITEFVRLVADVTPKQ